MPLAFESIDPWPVLAAPAAVAALTLATRGLPLTRPQMAVPGSSAASILPTGTGPAASFLAAALALAGMLVAAWAGAAAEGALLWASCAFGWSLLALAVIDIRHLRLPDILTLPLLLAGLGVTEAFAPEALIPHLLATLGGLAVFVLVREAHWRLRRREGLGLGDAKLVAALGAWLGPDGLASTVFIAALLGLALALLQVSCRRGAALEQALPFGAYLAAGAWLVWLYGSLVLG